MCEKLNNNSGKRQENDRLHFDLHFQCIVLVLTVGAFRLYVLLNFSAL